MEIGVHLHSTRATAGEKVRGAYDAGCRRFDSAMGGLGGCPFAQDELVGNLPTEEVLAALGPPPGLERPAKSRSAERANRPGVLRLTSQTWTTPMWKRAFGIGRLT